MPPLTDEAVTPPARRSPVTPPFVEVAHFERGLFYGRLLSIGNGYVAEVNAEVL